MIHGFCQFFQILEERSEPLCVDYDTVYKHIQQLNELIADGSEVEYAYLKTKYKSYSISDGNLLPWSHFPPQT